MCSLLSVDITIDVQITPIFTAIGPLCIGAAAPALPAVSNNGITGTWNPATISTAAAGTTTYTFTPAAGQCATTTTSIDVTVNATVTPTFTAVPDIVRCCTACIADYFQQWYHRCMDTCLANTATTTYTFTPAAGQCATTTTLTITVNATVTPTFTAIPDVCQMQLSPHCRLLPTMALPVYGHLR